MVLGIKTQIFMLAQEALYMLRISQILILFETESHLYRQGRLKLASIVLQLSTCLDYRLKTPYQLVRTLEQ